MDPEDAKATLAYIINKLETDEEFKHLNIRQIVKKSDNRFRDGEELKFRQPEIISEQMKEEKDENTDD